MDSLPLATPGKPANILGKCQFVVECQHFFFLCAPSYSPEHRSWISQTIRLGTQSSRQPGLLTLLGEELTPLCSLREQPPQDCLTLDTSGKFRGPQSHPHFRPASYKFGGAQDHPQVWSFAKITHISQESSTLCMFIFYSERIQIETSQRERPQGRDWEGLNGNFQLSPLHGDTNSISSSWAACDNMPRVLPARALEALVSSVSWGSTTYWPHGWPLVSKPSGSFSFTSSGGGNSYQPVPETSSQITLKGCPALSEVAEVPRQTKPPIRQAIPGAKPFFCCSVTQSCPTLWDPMDGSMPGLPVLHHLPEFAQTQVHWSWWCHPTISFSVAPFSSCLQPFPASGSFPRSRLFSAGSQSIGASASASVLPMNIQG